MRYTSLVLVLLLAMAQTSRCDLIVGDFRLNSEGIMTKNGAIKFSDMVNLQKRLKRLQYAYCATTAAVIAYLVYDKVQRIEEQKEQSEIDLVTYKG